MIIGDEGTHKSQIAKYISEYGDKINNDNEVNHNSNNEGIYYCKYTEDLKFSDFIGNQYLILN